MNENPFPYLTLIEKVSGKIDPTKKAGVFLEKLFCYIDYITKALLFP